MNYSLYLARRMSASSGNKRKSPAIKVAITAVALSVAVMLAAIAIVMGFRREIRDKVIGFNSHISVYSPAMTAGDDNLLTLTPSLTSLLDSIDFIRDYSLEASIPAILKTPDNFKGVYLRTLNGNGISNFIASNLVAGHIPDYSNDKESMDIVISEVAASQLGLKTGDRIDTFFISDDIRVRKLNVVGIFNTHFDTYDGIYIYGDLKLVQKLAGLSSNQGTSLSVNVNDFNHLNEDTELLHNILLKATASGRLYKYYQVDNVRHQGAAYFQWLDLLDTNVAVILTLMTFVAIMTLISGLLIIILDHKRFIGLIRALGAPVKKVRKIFVYLALKVGITGIAIGNILMLVFLWCQDRWHFLPLDPDSYYIDFVPVELNIGSVLLLNAGVIIIIWLALILPSMFVAKISPAETMRSE